MPSYTFFDRDMSWLTFNYRVLEEAAREETPLLERISFLSIYCSNLDEFYRVRFPALAALQSIKSTKDTYISADRIKLLTQISFRLNSQLESFGQLLSQRILPALAARGIHFIYAEPIPAPIKEITRNYFFTQLLAFLQPVYLNREKEHFFPENDRLYLLVVLHDPRKGGEQLVMVNIPSDSLPRLYDTTVADIRYILFIDDIIRDNMPFLFPGATIDGIYSLKITRDAELDLEDEYQGDLAEKIEKKLAKREAGLATRFLHEPGIPLRSLEALVGLLGLDRASVVTGGRYHNMRDLSGFPVKDKSMSYGSWPALRQKGDGDQPLLEAVLHNDRLLHVPYESYDPVLRFFNEAAIDPDVEEIYLTMYRVAKDSRIVQALISACRNGKKVTVFVELKARFDEANNLRWARKMKEAGAKIIYSIPALKVHAKIGLVKKTLEGRVHYAGLLATGNLNENTARFYTDHILLTGQHDLMRELELLFIFLSKRKDPRKAEKIAFKHLLVASFNLQERFIALIDREIAFARQGAPAHIIIKMNNLEEQVLISKLYEASEAGVRIQLLVRGICCCVPGVAGMSENISIKRIVDRYLEHGRVFIFHNNGQEEIFLGSSDWMNRNIYRRIEVCFPLQEPSLKEEVGTIIRLQLEDTVAAVAMDAHSESPDLDPVLAPAGHAFRLHDTDAPAVDKAAAPAAETTDPPAPASSGTPPIRSQEAIYRYLADRRGR